MASSGGFKNAINGFDKNEVNEYIGNLRKKLQEMEAEIKSSDEKIRAATKISDEADSRIREIESRSNQRVAELEAQVKAERKNSDALQNEIDELKRKLRRAESAGGASMGGGSTAEAERKSAEIVSKANAQARDIVEKAKQTAHQIISSASPAQSGGGVSEEALQSFTAILSELSKSVTNALNTANKKASEITGAPASQVSAPAFDLSAFSAPQADAPSFESAAPAFGFGAPEPEPKASSADDIFADMMDDSADMGDFGDMGQPDTPKAVDEPTGGFDLSDMGSFLAEEPAADVSPIDKKAGGAVFDEDFAADLLTQTVPSSALKDQVDDDMFSSMKERDDQFAVQPSDEKDFDMGGSASGGLDAMNELLGQMGAALENAGGSGASGSAGGGMSDMGDFGGFGGFGGFSNPEPAMDSGASDNPWADLQNQLNAMEESGNFGGSESSSAFDTMDSPMDDPKAPDADDSSIWNFDDDMSSGSSDDDMSADLFGSF